MLRDVNESRGQAPLGRRTRVLTLGALAMAGLAIAGLRGPGSTGKAEAAQAPAAPAVAKPGVTLEHGLIPADTAAIAVIRPAEVLTNPDLARFITELEPIKILQAKTGLKATDLEQMTVLWTFDALKGGPPLRPMMPSGAIFRMTGPQGWKEILTKNIPGLTEAKFGDVTYFELKEGPMTVGFGTPDDRTLVIAESPMLFRILAAKPDAADRAAWADAWKAVKKGQAAVAVDVSGVVARFRATVNNGPDAAIVSMFNPLLERANAYALSLNGIATCNNAENARQVADTLKAVLTLGRNAIESFRSQPGQAGIAPIINLGRPILEKATIVAEGTKVELSASSDLQVGQMIKLLVPSVEAQRAVARRVQSVNNLKQIGLAFFNYASAHDGKFLAASIIGPDGKTPHSWRVAILPYLEQQALYNAYKFDEPWDSSSNKKLLEQIPATYRYPGSKSATSSSYYVATGKDTLFPGTEGSSLAQITDGTSNTILAFEADRDIPWTKPEDVPFDANGALPKLGGLTPGGFNTLMADGSVRFIKDSVNPIVLKALFTRSAGEVISSDSF